MDFKAKFSNWLLKIGSSSWDPDEAMKIAQITGSKQEIDQIKLFRAARFPEQVFDSGLHGLLLLHLFVRYGLIFHVFLKDNHIVDYFLLQG